MTFSENQIYHIYNRGINRQLVYFKPENYIFFLEKIRKFILPHCEILNYSLMPTHFHFLVYADSRTTMSQTLKPYRNVMSEGFRNLLSSYTQAINKQEVRTGSLFSQNTKAKCMNDGTISYATNCFHYVHQNAFKANLVNKMEDWEFSSFKDYIGLRNGSMPNKKLAFEMLDLNLETIYQDSYKVIPSFDIDRIF